MPTSLSDPALTPVESAALQASPFEALYAPEERIPTLVVDNFPALGTHGGLELIPVHPPKKVWPRWRAQVRPCGLRYHPAGPTWLSVFNVRSLPKPKAKPLPESRTNRVIWKLCDDRKLQTAECAPWGCAVSRGVSFFRIWRQPVYTFGDNVVVGRHRPASVGQLTVGLAEFFLHFFVDTELLATVSTNPSVFLKSRR